MRTGWHENIYSSVCSDEGLIIWHSFEGSWQDIVELIFMVVYSLNIIPFPWEF